MIDRHEGFLRMRTLQVIVLLIFAVIGLRVAYIQLIDPRYKELPARDASAPPSPICKTFPYGEKTDGNSVAFSPQERAGY